MGPPAAGAHHLVAVVQGKHQLLEEPARVLLAEPFPARSAPMHRETTCQQEKVMLMHCTPYCREAYDWETWSKRLPPEAYSMTMPRYLSVSMHLQEQHSGHMLR